MSVRRVEDIILNQSDAEMVRIHNEWCERYNCTDSVIYPMEEFNYVLRQEDPMEIAKMVCYGDFNFANDYFMFDGYGRLRANYVGYMISSYDIALYCVNHDEDFGNDEIREALDEILGDDEEVA